MSGLVSRRAFIRTAVTATAASSPLAAAIGARAAESGVKFKPARSGGLIDTNVTLGRWPFRRLPLDETSALVSKLRSQDVTQAWAGSFEAVFHKDRGAANARLAGECRKRGRGLLLPFGSVNPKLPDWEEGLRRCHEVHEMPGIRLFPNYHGYPLDDPEFVRLLELARARGLVVQIAADMEDERMQHALARVPHVDAKPLLSLLENMPGLRLEVLNWFRAMRLDLVKQLAAAGAFFDIATLEGVGGVANLIEQIGESQSLFGSHAPLFYFESALLKLKESALNEERTRRVCFENARQLFPSRKSK